MSRLTDAKSALEQYEQTKPGEYQSQYKPQMDDVTGKLQQMGDFDYDPDADTAYQQYKNQYSQQAKKANENAQANAAAMTGGYANSYGTQAGQNAYNSTMANLDNVLDGLYNQSLTEYNTKKSGLQAELSGLQSAESQDYQNYQKDLANWYDGLQYRQNEYNSAYGEEQQKKSNGINIGSSILTMAASLLPYIIGFFL